MARANALNNLLSFMLVSFLRERTVKGK
jgi:hypothetical protein